MEVAIVILNWNGKHWLEKFLPSVVSHLNPKRDVLWVADNASTDDSIEWLKANYPDVELLEMKENTGYAGGYHEALNAIEADYYGYHLDVMKVTKDGDNEYSCSGENAVFYPGNQATWCEYDSTYLDDYGYYGAGT